MDVVARDGHDPTGGRGINGDMDNKLSSAEEEELFEGAVYAGRRHRSMGSREHVESM